MSLFERWEPPRPGWTCPECGFDYDALEPSDACGVVSGLGRRYRVPLTRGLPSEDLDAVVRTRPAPSVWSALEYACHVRDCLDLYRLRINRVLREHQPTLAPMNREAIAVDRHYNEQDPSVVADELGKAAEQLAERLAGLGPDDWTRFGTREGDRLSVGWMARNVVHEGNHHLLDIGRVLREARHRT